jgi:hypothetical protein
MGRENGMLQPCMVRADSRMYIRDAVDSEWQEAAWECVMG